MFKAVIHYGKRKILSGIDVSEKAGKVSKTMNTLDVHRLPTPLKILKKILRWYGRTGFKQRRRNEAIYPTSKKGHGHGLSGQGWKHFETAEFVNCSRAAVVKVYRAWQNGTVQNQRRGKCGAPRAIDDRGERRLRRCVRADRRATVEQLTPKMNQGATKSVSQTTIQRTLLRLGLRSRRLVRAPMLTAVHRRRRLEFARQYSSWTSTEWRQVAFSDESRFMLHRTDGRWRIRRETSERNHPATIAGTVQAGGGSIMVWGMFSWHSLGSLIIVEGTMDQYKYASVLADHVHPYMRIVFLRMMASSSRTMRGAIQLPVHVRGSKSTRMSLPSSPGQQSHLT
ncbi:transposable element Tcb1 transposase [Trichonephila clavipes]|nr:transposable element Tcb1 transposase [Trichonephila clavipes]